MKIGFVGGGHMGRALIGALRRSGVAADTLYVAEPNTDLRAALAADFDILATSDAKEFVSAIDCLVLAVKPQDMDVVLAPLKAQLEQTKPLVISIAAGLSVAQLQRWCGSGSRIVRAMPNRPALLGAGATGLYADQSVGSADRQRAESVLSPAGLTIWVQDEPLMDVVTALSGSGPAYFFRLAETLADAAVLHGLDRDAASRLAAATLHGAGLMAATGETLASLRNSVTSKGGTTAAALDSFAEAKLDAIVEQAVAAAIHRGRALAQQQDQTGG
jgi:pyrroline-5-carboxylate reductase